MMKNKISIFVRAKLKTSSGRKVPNGKMASQSAHALMGVFLSMFDKDDEQLTLRKENLELFNAFKNKTLDLEFLPMDEKKLESGIYNDRKNIIQIKDQGRTAFNEPTLTTIAVAPECYTYTKFIDCDAETGEIYASKQVMIINKLIIKDKWEMFEAVSLSSIQTLLNICIEIGDEIILPLISDGLKAWINGAFAKITLQEKEKNIIDAMKELNNLSVDNNMLASIIYKESEPLCVSFGPDFVESVDKHTKEGYRLA